MKTKEEGTQTTDKLNEVKIRKEIEVNEDGSFEIPNRITGDFFLDYLFKKATANVK